MDSTAIRTALEQFVIDNREFERLEDLLSEVNLFEAIGAVRTELRHSDFLAFLLDPSRNHGLKDIFLKRLIQHALSMARNNQSPVSPVDLDIWDLGDTKVWRERNNIDIFIANDRLKFAVVIENKIGTGEHSQQLERYRNLITQQYPECRIVFMYLTLAGDEPSDPDYIGVSYSTVNGILENIMESRGATLGQDMIVLLRHYTGMLRRNFMEESELILLAKSLYEKHRTALDFIFEHRPDVLSDIHDHLTRRIDSQSELVRDHCSKTLLYFLPKEWEKWPFSTATLVGLQQSGCYSLNSGMSHGGCSARSLSGREIRKYESNYLNMRFQNLPCLRAEVLWDKCGIRFGEKIF